jgi:hypothetical protein
MTFVRIVIVATALVWASSAFADATDSNSGGTDKKPMDTSGESPPAKNGTTSFAGGNGNAAKSDINQKSSGFNAMPPPPSSAKPKP